MAESASTVTDIGKRLAENMAYVVDEYHASGHVGKWCSEHCLPGLEANKALLGKFPANICEIMNSELSPVGHVIHHMGRWTCQLYAREMVDVLNMKTLGRVSDARSAAARKAARAGDAARASANKKARRR